MNIQKLRRFLSNDFNNAILSIRSKDGKIIPNLSLKEKTKLDGVYIDIYNEDINLLRKNPFQLCNYMLENFLKNHTVIGVKYITSNPCHSDKVCFDIITTTGTFTIAVAMDKIKLEELFPNFIQRLEFAKREGIIKSISQNDCLSPRLFLCLNDGDKNIVTGIGYYNYRILSYFENDKIVIPDYERKFVIRLIQEYLRKYQVPDNCCFESELLKLRGFIDEIKEKRVEFREYSINNLRFEFYNNERALTQLELIISAIEGIEKEFKYHTFSEMVAMPYKQLVIENYYRYGGRK